MSIPVYQNGNPAPTPITSVLPCLEPTTKIDWARQATGLHTPRNLTPPAETRATRPAYSPIIIAGTPALGVGTRDTSIRWGGIDRTECLF
ncbi:uncharacterized protein LAJ45_03554 [Morchella importuna]|uniref:uncharacterized protein n=1 Tax=Morchella importuna TaxID=1174673 RepID=UPI001E8EEE8F|nr:uncharacterized protein LAJ45_03554 [Morchella importuna]KAH8152128.1 hypothetical protein LAJ45_03554 [Morchella importuna]